MDNLRAELHCHNEFSNFHLGLKETPYDCGITVQEQMEQAHLADLDVLFITNHNTIDGYGKLLECKESHEKFKKIQVYPGEEVTTDQGIHVLAYGLTSSIKPGQSLEEVLDIVQSQGAISCAPHPFALNNGLRERAAMCDLIEVFNSNNVDRYSNLRAYGFAQSMGMKGVAGSDSHVLSTLGRCVNLIEAENTIDGVLRAMRKGKITIGTTGYITSSEMIEHARYKIKNSKDDIIMYFQDNHPHLTGLCRFLINAFESNPDSMVWTAVYKVAVHLTSKLSNKINFKNQDYNILYERNLKAILPMILT